MKKFIRFMLAALAVLTAAACSNVFMELVPKDETDIIRMSLSSKDGAHKSLGSKLSGTSIRVTLPEGSPLHALIPQAAIPEHATILPITTKYLQAAFPESSILDIYFAFMKKNTQKKTAIIEVFLELYRQNPNFSIPKMTIPIDFTAPVPFVVISGQGSSTIYTVYAVHGNAPDGGQAEGGHTGVQLQSCSFAKVKNPALMNDAAVSFDTASKQLTVQMRFPVEYAATDKPVPLTAKLTHTGESARIEYKGQQYNEDASIPVVPEHPSGIPHVLGSAEAKIHIEKSGAATQTYTLRLEFTEDPDTIRSITDFRFEKFLNPNITATAMASIRDEEDSGSIDITVLHTTPNPPESLIASFISPGTVTVDGAVQTANVSAHDFTNALQYLCTAKSGGFTRLYTVTVHFIYTEPAQAVLKSFSFPQGSNPALMQDVDAVIDEAAKTVDIELKYEGAYAPLELIAHFAATGTVSVHGVPQSSGFTKNNFAYTQYYKVTAETDSSVTAYYAVSVRFIASPLSACKLTSFVLKAQDNSALSRDITAVINPHKRTVSAVVPKATDRSGLVPSFTADGTVSINGVVQQSGSTAVDFTQPVAYTVTSLDGLNTTTYTVVIQEESDIIHVKPSAAGLNNGLDWENAFTSLDKAFAHIRTLPGETRVEIRLADEGRYTPVTIVNGELAWEIDRPFVLRGGFSGTESELSERQSGAVSTVDLAKLCSTEAVSGRMVFDSIRIPEGTLLQQMQWDRNAKKGHELVFEHCRADGMLTLADGWIARSGYGGSYHNFIKYTGSSLRIQNCTFAQKMQLQTPPPEVDSTGDPRYLYPKAVEISGSQLGKLEGDTNFAADTLVCRDSTIERLAFFAASATIQNTTITTCDIADTANHRLAWRIIRRDNANITIEDSRIEDLTVGVRHRRFYRNRINKLKSKRITVRCGGDFQLNEVAVTEEFVYSWGYPFEGVFTNCTLGSSESSRVEIASGSVEFHNCTFAAKQSLNLGSEYGRLTGLIINGCTVRNAPALPAGYENFYVNLAIGADNEPLFAASSSWLRGKALYNLNLGGSDDFTIERCFVENQINLSSNGKGTVDSCSFGTGTDTPVVGAHVLKNMNFTGRNGSRYGPFKADKIENCRFTDCKDISGNSFTGCTFTRCTGIRAVTAFKNNCRFTDCQDIQGNSFTGCTFTDSVKIRMQDYGGVITNCTFLFTKALNDTKIFEHDGYYWGDENGWRRYKVPDLINCTFDARKVPAGTVPAKNAIAMGLFCKMTGTTFKDTDRIFYNGETITNHGIGTIYFGHLQVSCNNFSYDEGNPNLSTFIDNAVIDDCTFENAGTLFITESICPIIKNSRFKSTKPYPLVSYIPKKEGWLILGRVFPSRLCILDSCTFSSPAAHKIILHNGDGETNQSILRKTAILLSGSGVDTVNSGIHLPETAHSCVMRGTYRIGSTPAVDVTSLQILQGNFN